MPRLCLGLERNHYDTSCSVGLWDDQLRMQPLFDHIVYMGTDASAYPPRDVRVPRLRWYVHGRLRGRCLSQIQRRAVNCPSQRRWIIGQNSHKQLRPV